MRLAPLFALTGLLALAPDARADLFAPRVEFPAGQDPIFLATGDFNHDGDRDIVTANTGASGSGVLLGGQGLSFGPFVPLGVGSANAVTVGDFNGDGDQDLAYAGPNGVQIVARADDGTFAAPAQEFVTSAQIAIAALDFTRDGDLDLVSIDSAGFFPFAWPMIGAAGADFSATGRGWLVNDIPRAVAVADFDQNGTQDLAITAHAGVVSLHQVGTGADIAEVATLLHDGGPESIAAGDFNGDGDPDLAITDLTGNSVSVRLGGAAFAFGDQTRYEVFAVADPQANGVATADFDGDGNLDLAVTGAQTLGVQVYLGRGDGTFTWEGVFAMGTPEPQEVVVDDFNADGRPDLAGVSKGPDTVSVLLNAAQPAIDTDPAGLSFGTQAQATIGAPRTLAVRSTGDRALRVQRLTTTGVAKDDFLITSDDCTGEVVAPGGSCEIAVRFAPQTGGAREASLQIESDAPRIGVPLSGTGGALPAGPAGPSAAGRDLLAAVFASDRHSARAGKRLRLRYVSTMDALVTVQLRRGTRVVRRLTATAVAGRNTLTFRVPARRGRYTLALTAVAGDQRVTDAARLTVLRRRT